MAKYRILRNYAKKPDTGVGEFTLHVATCMTGNPVYTTPIVTPDILRSKAGDLATAVSACTDGTKKDTAHKNVLRADLISTLDSVADYVERIAEGDLEKLLSSGFDVLTTGANAPAPVAPTSIMTVTNVATTKFGVTVAPAAHAWAVQFHLRAAGGAWFFTEAFTDLRHIVIPGLIPGTLYEMRVQVLGSKNQRSEWSESVTHMAT